MYTKIKFVNIKKEKITELFIFCKKKLEKNYFPVFLLQSRIKMYFSPLHPVASSVQKVRREEGIFLGFPYAFCFSQACNISVSSIFKKSSKYCIWSTAFIES